MNKVLFLIAALIMLSSCNNSERTEYTTTQEVKVNSKKHISVTHPGKKLMENKCYVCHNPKSDLKGRIAPPMVAVKSHYMENGISKKDFADAIWGFVKKPNPYKSKMKGAINRFGLMPYQEFKESDIRDIANYMYEYKIDEPEWFKKHIEEESKGKMQYHNEGKQTSTTTVGSDKYAFAKAEIKTKSEIGMQYALNTKKELGKNLMGTIQKKGTLEAVKFCNKRAYPITDSMAVAQNASIKRVSDKPRNPENQANAKELEIIAQFKKAIANKEDYQPVTEVENSEVKFYAPITTNSMCLQCHGTPKKDIEPQVFKALANLYPEDKALGYDVNEIRGIWSITYRR